MNSFTLNIQDSYSNLFYDPEILEVVLLSLLCCTAVCPS